MKQKPQNPFSVEDLEKEIEEEEQSRARGNFAKKTLGILVAIKKERLRLRKEVLEVIIELNIMFRKDNTSQRLSGDEFNDLWEEELKSRLFPKGTSGQEERE